MTPKQLGWFPDLARTRAPCCRRWRRRARAARLYTGGGELAGRYWCSSGGVVENPPGSVEPKINTKLGAAAVAAVGVVVALMLLNSGAQPPSDLPQVLVRGLRAEPSSFDIDSLHTADEMRAVRDAHAHLVEICRAELDRPEPAITSTKQIEIPGTAIAEDHPIEVSTNWTEGSCMWQAHHALGVDDPIRLEGLRTAIAEVVRQADERFEADSRVVGALNTWDQCSGLDSDNLTRLLSNSSAGAAPRKCRSELDLVALRQVRAEHHLTAAAPNQLLIDEYVTLLDTQVTAAAEYVDTGSHENLTAGPRAPQPVSLLDHPGTARRGPIWSADLTSE